MQASTAAGNHSDLLVEFVTVYANTGFKNRIIVLCFSLSLLILTLTIYHSVSLSVQNLSSINPFLHSLSGSICACVTDIGLDRTYWTLVFDSPTCA